MRMTSSEAIVECIRREGVGHVFCVPGESYLGVIDALYAEDEVELVSNRQEGGAAFAAEAYAKASGLTGVCMVTRGPGSCNASIGVHTARQDSTPMVLFVGQVERASRYREGFQEVDLESFFRPLAKWTVEIRDPRRVPEMVQRAFRVARSGRPGPVVVALPEDLLSESVEMDFSKSSPAKDPAAPSLAPEEARAILEELTRATKAVVIAGGGVLRAGASGSLVEFSERFELPVFSAFRRQDVFPNDHRNYLGHLGLGISPEQRRAVEEAEVVFALGTRLSEITTQGYTLPGRDQRLLHVDIDPEVFGAYLPPTFAATSDAGRALEVLLKSSKEQGPGSFERRREWAAGFRESYEEYVEPEPRFHEREGYVDPALMVQMAQDALPEDAVITVDAGNFAGWVQRFYQFQRVGTFVGPTSGAMGYGVPAALGAALARPGRVVVSFSGDGGFMMTAGEIETGVRNEVPFVSIVVNNAMYGTIRMHQERNFPGRVHATGLSGSNLSELAKSLGAHARRITATEDFPAALKEAVSESQTSKRPAVIEVMTAPEQLTVSETIESLRAGG